MVAIDATASDSFLTISDSTFINNQVIGSAGSGNSGSCSGGALFNSGSTATISHSTFIGNQAIGGDGDGDGGFARAGAIGGAGTLTIEDSTFKGNRAIGGNGHVGASGRGTGPGVGEGGAIMNNSGGILVLTRSVLGVTGRPLLDKVKR